MSLIPKDLLVSPYAARDALADAARLQSPLKPSSRLATSHLPPVENYDPEEAEVEEDVQEEMMQAQGGEEVEVDAGGEDAAEGSDVGSELEEDESMEEQDLELEEAVEGEDKENAQASTVLSVSRCRLSHPYTLV
jgi:hypothetical protein